METKTQLLMKTSNTITLVAMIFVLTSSAVFAQTAKTTKPKNETAMESKVMNTYVIEREIPDAGKLKAEDLQGISKTSCSVLKELGPDIQWLHSYVTDNKIFCVYKAENEEILKEHAKKGGFPINAVHKLSTVISPETATAQLDRILPKN
jgi:hypothetical protein